MIDDPKGPLHGSSGKPAMAKKSPEQLKEDDDRTTSMGPFNTAEAYRLAAIKLGEPSVWGGHAYKPVQFLYCHAIELYLKALLRQKHSVEVITNKFRHDTKGLVREAENLGLFVTTRDRDIFATFGRHGRSDRNALHPNRTEGVAHQPASPIADLQERAGLRRQSFANAGVPVR
jgi:hypothetical protein